MPMYMHNVHLDSNSGSDNPIPGKFNSLIPVPIPMPARNPLILDSDSSKKLRNSGIEHHYWVLIHECMRVKYKCIQARAGNNRYMYS